MGRPSRSERERRDLEAVAYHEAGHAVMALEFNHAIQSMSIVPDMAEGNLGHLRHPKRYQPSFNPQWGTMEDARFQTTCIRMILIALAGPAAEEHFTGHPNPNGAPQDARSMFAGRSKGADQAALWGRPIAWIQLAPRAQSRPRRVRGNPCESASTRAMQTR